MVPTYMHTIMYTILAGGGAATIIAVLQQFISITATRMMYLCFSIAGICIALPVAAHVDTHVISMKRIAIIPACLPYFIIQPQSRAEQIIVAAATGSISYIGSYIIAYCMAL